MRNSATSKRAIVFSATFEPRGEPPSSAIAVIAAASHCRGRGSFTAPCAGALALHFDNTAAWRGSKSALLWLAPDPYLRSLRRASSAGAAPSPGNSPGWPRSPSRPGGAASSSPSSASAAAAASAVALAASAAARRSRLLPKLDELHALHRWRFAVEAGPLRAQQRGAAGATPLQPLAAMLSTGTAMRCHPHPDVDIDAPPRLRLRRVLVTGIDVDPTLPPPKEGEKAAPLVPMVCHIEAIAQTTQSGGGYGSARVSLSSTAAKPTLQYSSMWTRRVVRNPVAGLVRFDSDGARIVGDTILRFFSGASGLPLFHFTVHSAFLLADDEGHAPDDRRRFARLVRSVDPDLSKKSPAYAALFGGTQSGFACKLELELEGGGGSRDATAAAGEDDGRGERERGLSADAAANIPFRVGMLQIEQPGWRGAWKDCYVVLSGGQLQCFESRRSVLPLYSIDVARSFTAAADGFDGSRFNVMVPMRSRGRSELDGRGEPTPTYAFRTGGTEEQRAWVLAIAAERVTRSHRRSR